MLKWNDYKNKKLENPEFKKAYDALEEEYSAKDKTLKFDTQIKSNHANKFTIEKGDFAWI